MKFTKMHGAGNDYVYVNAFTETLPADLSRLATLMSDRHGGVGADGLIVISPSAVAAARMRMWNADGSRAEMCGNGIRCVAKYLYDQGILRKSSFPIETDAGVKTVWVELAEGTVERVRVSMGVPVLEAAAIPTLLPGNPPLTAPLEVAGRLLEVACVSMGNPHCIVPVEELADEAVLRLGPLIERHPAFPDRVNVEFVQVLSRDQIRLRVWERGSGETLACGTGACAAVVACVLRNLTSRHVACHLPGGRLDVEWNADDNQVYLTGPAVEVFQGTWPSTAASPSSTDAVPYA